jgi:chorismate mutase/GNAT superfamily N-acetyltransferase
MSDGTDDLLLRPATPEDADTLACLFWDARRAAHPAMPASVHTRTEVGHWFAEVLGLEPRTTPMPDDRETWVAERDGEVVGYVVLDPEWLDSLYVRPDLTGQGIGSALLDLVKGLRPGGFALWVFETNTGARRFYARHGLWELERTDGSTNEEGAPDLRMAWPGRDPVRYLRAQVDEVDTELARVLARRAALTAAIQQHKQVPGEAGRDPDREAQIVDRMAVHVPALGRAGLARVMDAVITAGLEAAERENPDT